MYFISKFANLQEQDRIFFARKNRRTHRKYRKESHKGGGGHEDGGQTPFIPLEEVDDK